MNLVALAAKAGLAVMLLVAGSAKLADLASFAAAVRLLLTFRVPRGAVRAAALAVALTELVAGVASLVLPSAGWINPVVLALACGFVLVSGLGYLFHRGRSCRCFGALSNRRFDLAGIARSLAIAATAAVAMVRVPPAMTGVGPGSRTLLLASAAVVGLAAFSAARALGSARKLELETS
ncbi:MAG TPA: MauE/DoxX family redox-associated membrane protein [Streptosporangiaceae bacterium]|nr:MauE/DoxX family redox-associated membrane protein [Streptosporangiaceae bacterium]